MTQADLAALVRIRRKRVTASYISRLERGRLDPRLSTVLSIARALRIKPWQLLAYPESPRWWDDYLALPPIGKREAQRVITWYRDRRH
jgi:transcriptional regulator with XRE-family HTH domain